MSGIPFYNTRMGHTFYEHTMPELVRQITRLNELLEQIAARLPKRPAAPPDPPEGATRQ